MTTCWGWNWAPFVTKGHRPTRVDRPRPAVLRRLEKQQAGEINILREGKILSIALPALHLLWRGGEPTPSEFELLATMMATPGRVFSRLELLERLQGTA